MNVIIILVKKFCIKLKSLINLSKNKILIILRKSAHIELLETKKYFKYLKNYYLYLLIKNILYL